MPRDPELQALLDRHAVEDVLYRYASTIDVKDYERLRTLFADDAVARYGERDWLRGGDAIVAWIRERSSIEQWQHHLLSVYHVDIDGDSASALTYHTSHQTSPDRPGVSVIVARYRDELRRTDGGWKFTSKVMEIGWRETRGTEGAS